MSQIMDRREANVAGTVVAMVNDYQRRRNHKTLKSGALDETAMMAMLIGKFGSRDEPNRVDNVLKVVAGSDGVLAGVYKKGRPA